MQGRSVPKTSAHMAKIALHFVYPKSLLGGTEFNKSKQFVEHGVDAALFCAMDHP